MGPSLAITAIFSFISVIQISSTVGFSLTAERTFQVFIKRNGKRICGGAAITNDEIVTAASCLNYGHLDGLKVMSVGTAGQLFGTPHVVVDRCIHGEFKDNAKDHANDIVVLRLHEPIKRKNSLFTPIEMAESNFKVRDGDAIEVTGYGLDQENKPGLVVAGVFKTPDKYCKGNYSDLGGPTADQFCADRHKVRSDDETLGQSIFNDDFGACDGDRGVSAVIEGKLVGHISNWKPDCEASIGLPVIFTSIAYHRKFIDNCLREFENRKTGKLYDGSPKKVNLPPLVWKQAKQEDEDGFFMKILKGAYDFLEGPDRMVS